MESNNAMNKPNSHIAKDLGNDFHVPNLERALIIMETLANSVEGLSISEASDQLNIPRNSAHRIMMTLLKHGYLSRNEDSKAFRLTKKMLVIGYGAFRDKKLVEYALEPMRELRNITKETVPLGVLYDETGVIIEQVTGLHMFKYVLEPGKNFNINTAAPAKAIMAFLPENEQNIILEKVEFRKYTPRTITSKKLYLKYLSTVRERGFAIDEAEEYDGMHCIGAPVFDQHGYPIAAIWITGPSSRIPKDKFNSLGKLVKNHALKISDKLGYGLQKKLLNEK